MTQLGEGDPGQRGSEGEEIPQERIPVLIAGLPGKMATAAAEAIVQSPEDTLTKVALTSPRHECEIRAVGGGAVQEI